MTEEIEQKPPQPDLELVQNNERFEVSSLSVEFSGILPPPNILGGYEEIIPGAADRLLKMAEREQQNRHKMDKCLLDAQIADAKQDRMEARIGQVFALIIGMTAILTGGATAVNGAPLAGGFIGSAGVGGLAAVFISGRKERASKGTED